MINGCNCMLLSSGLLNWNRIARVDGNAFIGVYNLSAMLPAGLKPGPWSLKQITMQPRIGPVTELPLHRTFWVKSPGALDELPPVVESA